MLPFTLSTFERNKRMKTYWPHGSLYLIYGAHACQRDNVYQHQGVSQSDTALKEIKSESEKLCKVTFSDSLK